MSSSSRRWLRVQTFFRSRSNAKPEVRKPQVKLTPVPRRESAYPFFRCAAAAARRGADGRCHPVLGGSGQLAQAILRHPHAPACPRRDRAGCSNRSRRGANDSGGPDERRLGCPDSPTPPRRPSLADAAPRRAGTASHVSAKLGFHSSIRSTQAKAIGGLTLVHHCRPIRPFKWRVITQRILSSWHSIRCSVRCKSSKWARRRGKNR